MKTLIIDVRMEMYTIHPPSSTDAIFRAIILEIMCQGFHSWFTDEVKHANCCRYVRKRNLIRAMQNISNTLKLNQAF